MMNSCFLSEIPFLLDAEQVLDKLHIKKGDRYKRTVQRMAGEASRLGNPRAAYRACRIVSRGEDHVVLEGVTFHSRVLAVNLEKVHRAFPFVATCGRELERWSGPFSEGIEPFCAAEIKQMALGAAIMALVSHIEANHHPGPMSMMNPGSLEDWPIREQVALFEVLESPQDRMGVELMESGLMKPSMTASGIWFPSQEHFENCMLCPMKDCPGRRAPYERDLFDNKYARKKKHV
jgi:hypothetical protein